MKRLAPVAAILLLVLAALGGRATADPPIGAAYGQFTANAQSFVARCSGGQSTAVVSVDNSGTLVGTVTVSTAAQDANANPILPYGTPLSSTPPGSSTQTTTITSYPGKLYVTLGSDGFVQAATTAYSSGTANMSIVCTGAVARAPSGGSSPAPTVCPSAGQNITISGTYPCTVAETVTAGPQATPSPQATTAAGCANAVWSSTWPYLFTSTQPVPITQLNTTTNNSAATGTTANTYVEIAEYNGTTGTSCGTNNNWLLTIFMPLDVAAAQTNSVYGCAAITTGTVTRLDSILGVPPANCVTTLTNSIGGTVPFGTATLGLSAVYMGHYTIANSSSFTMKFYAASSGVVSETVYGFGDVTVQMH